MRKAALFQMLLGSSLKWGPFQGMAYICASVNSVLGPKLLGTYEQEIYQSLNEACARKPTLIVDVGAAEGYYAVGLALKNPDSEIVAFEADPEGRKLLQKMVGKNAVDHQVRIENYCTPQALESALSGAPRALVVMDVEGGEEMLLNPSACPSLLHSEIIVELHDFIIPGIGNQLCRRFAASHHIQEIPEHGRTLDDLPSPLRHLAKWLPKGMFMEALKEHRPARMSWLHLVPKAAN